MNKEQIKIKVSEFLYNREEIIFAYIFGSFVKRENYHDIDIAIFHLKNFEKNNLTEYPYGYESFLIGNLMKTLHTNNIDLVILNNAPLLITNRIINSGLLLFDKDKILRINFENRNRKFYIDAENLRKIKTFYFYKE